MLDERTEDQCTQNQGLSRRELLKGAGFAAASVAGFGALSACTPAGSSSTSASASSASSSSTSSGNSGTAAKAVHSWDMEAKPADIAQAEIIQTVETEILICGGGYAGMACATKAAQDGAKVIVVEKDNRLHGNGIGGTGGAWSKLMEETFAPDWYLDKPINQARWVTTCGGRCRESLVAKWFRESERTMDWLLDMSIEDNARCVITATSSNLELHKEEQCYHWIIGGTIEPYGDVGAIGTRPEGVPPEVNMSTWVEYRFKAKAEATGNCEIIFESPVVQLVQPDGPGTRVTGAICKTDEGYIQYNASKGVVLATGDISYNDEMMDHFAPIGQKVYAKLNGAPGNVGDGHKFGHWAGGAFQDGPWPTMLHPQAASTFHGPFMFVDLTGRRFFNEATWVQGKCVGIMTQTKRAPGQTGPAVAWSIFDANWKEYLLESLPYGGGMFWDMFRAVGTSFEDAVASAARSVENGVANNTGNFVQADSLEELAGLIGVVDTAAFLDEVKRYNAFAAKGEDEDFFKDPRFVTPIDTPPYIAAKVGTGLLCVPGGLHISDDCEVLTEDEKPIPGLYACGNTMGDIYAVDYPINIFGNSHGRCLTFGYLLGEHLAAK